MIEKVCGHPLESKRGSRLPRQCLIGQLTKDFTNELIVLPFTRLVNVSIFQKHASSIMKLPNQMTNQQMWAKLQNASEKEFLTWFRTKTSMSNGLTRLQWKNVSVKLWEYFSLKYQMIYQQTNHHQSLLETSSLVWYKKGYKSNHWFSFANYRDETNRSSVQLQSCLFLWWSEKIQNSSSGEY